MLAYFAVFGIANGVWLARIPAVKADLHLTDGVLGVAHDATFGPLLMVGRGGTDVEVLDDLVWRPVPLGEDKQIADGLRRSVENYAVVSFTNETAHHVGAHPAKTDHAEFHV